MRELRHTIKDLHAALNDCRSDREGDALIALAEDVHQVFVKLNAPMQYIVTSPKANP
jgi:hypothetical protein